MKKKDHYIICSLLVFLATLLLFKDYYKTNGDINGRMLPYLLRIAIAVIYLNGAVALSVCLFDLKNRL